MSKKVTMKVTIEFESEDNMGNSIKNTYVENCHDLEMALINQKFHETAYLFNWDAIVKQYYKKFKNSIEEFEIF